MSTAKMTHPKALLLAESNPLQAAAQAHVMDQTPSTYMISARGLSACSHVKKNQPPKGLSWPLSYLRNTC